MLRLRLLLFAAVGGLLAACQPSVEDAMRLADEARAKSEFREAYIHLRNVIQREPDLVEARLALGDLSFDMGDFAGAVQQFRRAEALGASLADYRLTYCTSLLSVGEAAQVVASCRPEEFDPVQQADALLLAGRAEQALGNAAAAETAILRALRLRPAWSDAEIALATALQSQQRFGEALSLLDQVIAREGDVDTALVQRGRQHLLAGSFAAGIADLQRVVDSGGQAQNPNRVAALVHLAEAHLLRGEFDRASAVIATLEAEVPQAVITRHLRAWHSASTGDAETAKRLLYEVVAQQPGYVPALSLLGTVHAQLGEYGQAEMHLIRVLRQRPEDRVVRSLLARVQMQLDTPEAALETLGDMPVGEALSNDVLLLAGQANLRAGRQEQALALLDRSMQAAGSEEERLRVIASLIGAGELDEAERLLKSRGGAGPLEQLAGNYLLILSELRAENWDAAQERAEQLLREYSDQPQAHYLAGSVATARRELAAARVHFEDALSIDPQFEAAHLALADLAARTGDLAETRRRLDEIFDFAPDSEPAAIAMARLDLAVGDRTAALERLEAFRLAAPDSRAVRAELVRVYGSSREIEKALRPARELLALAPRNAELHNAAGLLEMRAERHSAAAEDFERAVELESDNASYRVNLARALWLSGNRETALDKLVEARSRAPRYVPAAMLEFEMAHALGQRQRANRIAEGIAAIEPALAATLQGDAAVRDGRDSEAAELYQRALDLRPVSDVVVKLFGVRKRQGVPDAAVTLERWLESNPNDSAIRFLLATERLSEGDQARAIRELEGLLEIAPDHAEALNNLAWLKRDDPSAVELAERANSLMPDSPAIMDTLGWLYFEHGRTEAALPLLRRARGGLPNEPEIAFHLASVLIDFGQTEEGRSLLEDTLEAHPQFGSRGEALALLETVR